ncbi:hypothetical protein B566_EDAN002188 [Ephemera danica]|nr:hypothetical protein B566_EDAN002188 [Ephemera danica]
MSVMELKKRKVRRRMSEASTIDEGQCIDRVQCAAEFHCYLSVFKTEAVYPFKNKAAEGIVCAMWPTPYPLKSAEERSFSAWKRERDDRVMTFKTAFVPSHDRERERMIEPYGLQFYYKCEQVASLGVKYRTAGKRCGCVTSPRGREEVVRAASKSQKQAKKGWEVLQWHYTVRIITATATKASALQWRHIGSDVTNYKSVFKTYNIRSVRQGAAGGGRTQITTAYQPPPHAAPPQIITEGRAECPRACECKWRSGKEAALCIGANLTSVPQHLDAGTQVLDFTGNHLTEIGKDTFSNAGLTNLQKIYLAKCRIRKLDRYTFRKLTNLVELDLSYNFLTTVPSHILDSIGELRELKLTGNPIQRIMNDAFQYVPHLVRLELSECRIGTLEHRSFFGLTALEWLKLDSNIISSIRPETITSLTSLHELDLHGNPWNCSCALRPLRDWMIKQNVPYGGVAPVCKLPPRLAAKPWEKLELDDFACVPGIAAKVALTKGVEGSNVTMSCRIDGVPEPKVKWLWKNRVIANVTFGRKTYVVEEIGDTEKASNLTILAAEIQDAGTYICVAENKAGKVEANVTLAMSRRAPDPALPGRVIAAGILVAALSVLAACLVAVCVCSARRKHDVRAARRRRRADSYEKIEMNHKPPTANHTSNGPGGSTGGVAMSAANLARHPRHAEYRGVPSGDTGSPRRPSPLSVTQAADAAWSARSPDGAGSSEAGHNGDTESCAARSTRCSDSEASDPDTLRPPAVLPAYRDHREEGVVRRLLPARPTVPGYPFPAAECVRNTSPDLHERVPSIELKDLHIHAPPLPPDPDDEKGYPDVVNPYGDPGHMYGTESFCTLPRRPYGNSRWRRGGCSDSQSPLLPDSRYNSSEDSNGSIRRYSGEVSVSNYRQRSSSSLNISSENYRESFATISGAQRKAGRFPSLPTSPIQSEVSTPLLGHQGAPVYATPATPSNVVSSYDYHAAQLERFLEEYRSLQQQLNKMKETCDTLRIEPSTSTSRPSNTRSLVEPLLDVTKLPGAEPVLKNSSPIPSVSPSSNVPTSNPPPGAAPPPYWVPRSSIRRYSDSNTRRTLSGGAARVDSAIGVAQ